MTGGYPSAIELSPYLYGETLKKLKEYFPDTTEICGLFGMPVSKNTTLTGNGKDGNPAIYFVYQGGEA